MWPIYNEVLNTLLILSFILKDYIKIGFAVMMESQELVLESNCILSVAVAMVMITIGIIYFGLFSVRYDLEEGHGGSVAAPAPATGASLDFRKPTGLQCDFGYISDLSTEILKLERTVIQEVFQDKGSMIEKIAEKDEEIIMAEEEEEEIMIMEKEKWINLPQEIIIEILSWLPANSLVSSFKFVCKPWRNLIHDPDFINMHLNRGAIHGGGGLIRKPRTGDIRTMDGSRFGNKLFQLKPPFNYQGFVIAPRIKLDVDFNLFPSSSRLVGSCNGLLCISDSLNEMLNLDEGIILLNPSTRKCKISPKKPIERPPFPFTSHKPATYGFGCYYNSTTTIDEYKVVRIVHFYPARNWGDPQSFQLQIDIYSMSSNSWRSSLRRVEGIPYDISQERFGLFLNGAVHWMGCKLQNGDVWYWDTIVSFNIRDEEFRQVPMPPCADVIVNDIDDAEYPYLNDYTILMNVRGCLGNAYFSRTEMMDVVLEIWVMKEYGIGESWTKEFVIRTSDSDPLRELSRLYMYSRYMTCFLTGDKILIEVTVSAGQVSTKYRLPCWKDYGRRVLYDMNKKEIDGDFVMIDMPYEHYRDDQVDYIETLVSLISSPLPSSNN